MTHAGKQGVPFPINTEFSEVELKSYESRLTTLVVTLLKTTNIPESIWISPVNYAYRYEEGKKIMPFTWLERPHIGCYRGVISNTTITIPHPLFRYLQNLVFLRKRSLITNKHSL